LVRRALAAVFFVLFAVRLVEVQTVWDSLAHESAAFLRSVQSIERGGRVLVAHGDREAYVARTVSDFELLHAASLATIERSALVSTIFAVPGKHVLQVGEPFRRFVNLEDYVPPSVEWLPGAAEPAARNATLYWSQWPQHFDYVYVLFTDPGGANPDPRHLALVVDGPGFQLYRVTRKS
jgi:hypothetical protein